MEPDGSIHCAFMAPRSTYSSWDAVKHHGTSLRIIVASHGTLWKYHDRVPHDTVHTVQRECRSKQGYGSVMGIPWRSPWQL